MNTQWKDKVGGEKKNKATNPEMNFPQTPHFLFITYSKKKKNAFPICACKTSGFAATRTDTTFNLLVPVYELKYFSLKKKKNQVRIFRCNKRSFENHGFCWGCWGTLNLSDGTCWSKTYRFKKQTKKGVLYLSFFKKKKLGRWKGLDLGFMCFVAWLYCLSWKKHARD